MLWRLNELGGRPITAGAEAQMKTYLPFMAPDGQYVLIGPEEAHFIGRYRGLLYSLDSLDDWVKLSAAELQVRLGKAPP